LNPQGAAEIGSRSMVISKIAICGRAKSYFWGEEDGG
jgi:hypothetical protein